MTAFQIIACAAGLVSTLHYAPGLWRRDTVLPFGAVVVWSLIILTVILSFIGVKF